ncbi:MAG: flagellar basal body P-ring formation chaperone FlgA [Phycisphaerae bacterium]
MQHHTTDNQLFIRLAAVTALAWATQTLVAQWLPAAHGQVLDFAARMEVPADDSPAGQSPAAATAPAPAMPAERYVPGRVGFSETVTLELRSDVRVIGEEVRLRQLVRWRSNEERLLGDAADLIILRLPEAGGSSELQLAQLKQLLHDAGVNLGQIHFIGAARCSVRRADALAEAADVAMRRIDAANKNDADVILARHQGEPDPFAQAAERRTLKAMLEDNLAAQTGLAREQLQLAFSQDDAKLLALAEPFFKFEITPHSRGNLGDVSWRVAVSNDAGTDKVFVKARARAWVEQLVVARPVGRKQVIQAGDVEVKRLLVDRVPDDAPLNADQAVGQLASRDLNIGDVVSSRVLESVPLAKAGQFITVMINHGGVEVTTVARALEGGSYGQAIRVRNEQTREIYTVTLVGPQQGAMTGLPPHATLPTD